MSLQAQPIPPIPELTVQIARAAFRKGNVYMQMRDLLIFPSPMTKPLKT
jgi:transposase